MRGSLRLPFSEGRGGQTGPLQRPSHPPPQSLPETTGGDCLCVSPPQVIAPLRPMIISCILLSACHHLHLGGLEHRGRCSCSDVGLIFSIKTVLFAVLQQNSTCFLSRRQFGFNGTVPRPTQTASSASPAMILKRWCLRTNLLTCSCSSSLLCCSSQCFELHVAFALLLALCVRECFGVCPTVSA